MQELPCRLLQLYVIALVLRAVMTWFPPPRSGFVATISEFLFTITEPVLRPLRRVIPPIGGLDLSFLVLMFVIFAIQSQIC
jgi:YggT family protein